MFQQTKYSVRSKCNIYICPIFLSRFCILMIFTNNSYNSKKLQYNKFSFHSQPQEPPQQLQSASSKPKKTNGKSSSSAPRPVKSSFFGMSQEWFK